MFKLESNVLKREFKITNGNFYASQILNKVSRQGFVPDGNGCEFVILFTDGTEVSSKGLQVMQSSEENNKLKFVFAEELGTTVTLEYWVHEDGNTLCKQVTISQNNSKVIDRVFLENVGIINSQTHYGVDPKTHRSGENLVTALGQPFYIDSLFFACESPAVESKIIHGAGQTRYFLGKNVGKDFKCPVTVIGGGADNTMPAMKKAFSNYIDFISVKSPLRFNYVDQVGVAAPQEAASKVEGVKTLQTPDMPQICDYVFSNLVWNAEKAPFWEFGKQWQNGFKEINAACSAANVKTGLGIKLAGRSKKFAKKVQKAGNGFVSASVNDELCLASARYNDKISEYLANFVRNHNIDYIELDFGKSETDPCTDSSHDHGTGGKGEMYYINDLLENRVALVSALRKSKPDMFIALCGVHNVSPFWRQWVNAIDCTAVGDTEGSYKDDEMPTVEAAITNADTLYYDVVCKHGVQLPADAMMADFPFEGVLSNDEFNKVAMWSAVRGEGLIDLDCGYELLDDAKRGYVAKALKFKSDNQHILKNCSFIGGRPADGNIYGFVSWTDEGEGIIAMRNPTNEKTPITLTLNKLMGVPKELADARRENAYSVSILGTSDTFSYGSKINIALHPYECVIFKFTK